MRPLGVLLPGGTQVIDLMKCIKEHDLFFW